jgi:hypothetical protein
MCYHILLGRVWAEYSCQFFACSQAGIGIPVQRRAWLMFVIVGGGPTFFGDNVQAGIQQ